jgi:hypothetical protein
MEKIIFVFGSNIVGRHGKGAALVAKLRYGAIQGRGEGLQGDSYGIPTKDERIKTLDLISVYGHVQKFISFAINHPDMKFHVTRIGCGLAGYKDSDIAPLFLNSPDNCKFSSKWKAFLPKHDSWCDL